MSFLERQIEVLTQQVELLRARIVELESENQRLHDKIAQLEKNSSNSSKPPSSDIINPQPDKKSKKKRKIGGQKGHPKHSRKPFGPDEIDRTIIHTLPANEVRRRGLIAMEVTKLALQQIDLPEKLFNVIEHRLQLYMDPNGRIVEATLPKDIRKSGLFSPRMIALTGYLKARSHMSYSTLQAFFRDIMDLDVSESFLAKGCTRKLSAVLQEAYGQVAQFIRHAPIVGSDETGHKNAGYTSAWAWCQQTPEAIFYHISPSRASQVLIDILGLDFEGILICDYFSANKKFVALARIWVQYCWAHLIRDIKFLTTLTYKNVRQWAEGLLVILRKLFELYKSRHRRHSGRYKKAIQKLRTAFLRKVRRPPDHDQAVNIKKRFVGAGEKRYFLFLQHEGVSPTNNATEQAIRFVVLDRRVTQGTRSWAGMRFCERAWTAVGTCMRHKRSVYQFFLDAVNATYNDTPYPKLIPAKV